MDGMGRAKLLLSLGGLGRVWGVAGRNARATWGAHFVRCGSVGASPSRYCREQVVLLFLQLSLGEVGLEVAIGGGFGLGGLPEVG